MFLWHEDYVAALRLIGGCNMEDTHLWQVLLQLVIGSALLMPFFFRESLIINDACIHP